MNPNAAPPTDAGDDALQVRLWLRMLGCTNAVEARLRCRLQDGFDTTMPRFDALAQLARAPEGMTMGRLSARMMVTKGNITGLVDRLAAEGLVERVAVPGDRRSSVVRLTEDGRRRFAEMAPAMRQWIHALLAEMDRDALEALYGLLGRLRQSVRAGEGDER